jgi:hypothetical protein
MFATIRPGVQKPFALKGHDSAGRLAYHHGEYATFAEAAEAGARQRLSVTNAVWNKGWQERGPRDWYHDADAPDWYVAPRLMPGDFCRIPAGVR